MSEPFVGEAYCVDCEDKRTFIGEVVVRNGRRFAVGSCPECATDMTRVLGRETDDPA